jgi:catabolite regulation protein CreA
VYVVLLSLTPLLVKFPGVTLYISNFQRPLTERLSKDFFSDPSDASVTCAKTGAVVIADNIAVGKGGEEVFEESKSLLFKTLRVQRIYDKEKNTVVYVSYNTRLDKNDDTNKSRFKSSVCAVYLE